MSSTIIAWEFQGCEQCRGAWSRGGGAPLRELGTNFEKHARVHQCQVCGAYWDENERYAAQISEAEAVALLQSAD